MNIYEFFFSPWFWFALVVVFSMIELASSFTFVTIWFALAAFAMIFISGFTEMLDMHLRFSLHIGIFVLLSALLLFFTRPIAIKKLKVGSVKTNVAELIGQDALVTKKISKYEKGEAKINGKMWTAVSENGEEIDVDTECVVLRIEGVKLIVKIK